MLVKNFLYVGENINIPRNSISYIFTNILFISTTSRFMTLLELEVGERFSTTSFTNITGPSGSLLGKKPTFKLRIVLIANM